MQRHLFLTTLLLLGLLVSGCSSSAPATPAAGSFPNTPEGVVRKMLDSIEKNDANQYLDSVTPEDRKQPGYFFYTQVLQGLMGAVGLGNVDAAHPKVSFRELSFETARITDIEARVHVTGKMRELTVAMESDFDTSIIAVKMGKDWYCSLAATETLKSAKEAIPATALPQPGPKPVAREDEAEFRERVIETLSGLTSLRSTGQGVEDSPSGTERYTFFTEYASGREHSATQYESGRVFHVFTKSGTQCTQENDEQPECRSSDSVTGLEHMKRFVSGQAPREFFTIIDSGSSLSSHQGKDCRSYFAVSDVPASYFGFDWAVVMTDEECFDIDTYLPVRGSQTAKVKDNGATWWSAEWQEQPNAPVDFKFPGE